jgi:FdhD protein
MARRIQEVFRAIWAAGRSRRSEDRVAVEEPLEIRVEDQPFSVTMRTPGEDLDLAAGFLFTEGLVERPDELPRLRHCTSGSPEEAENLVIASISGEATGRFERLRRRFVTTSACGICGRTSLSAVHIHFPPLTEEAVVSAAVLEELPRLVRQKQDTFEATGGLHAAGLFERDGRLRRIREDVGRHNAVDKVIGASFLAGEIPLRDTILLVSGRASFEIVQKALAARIPVLAAVSAPSSLAVELARASNQILVGFLREGSFNVYSGEERVTA